MDCPGRVCPRRCLRKDWTWHSAPWSSSHRGVWSQIRLNDLWCLFWPKWFGDSVMKHSLCCLSCWCHGQKWLSLLWRVTVLPSPSHRGAVRKLLCSIFLLRMRSRPNFCLCCFVREHKKFVFPGQNQKTSASMVLHSHSCPRLPTASSWMLPHLVLFGDPSWSVGLCFPSKQSMETLLCQLH